jgi:hypothetical protein
VAGPHSTMTFHRSRVEAQLCHDDEFVLAVALDVGRLRIPVPLTVPLACCAVRPDGPDAGVPREVRRSSPGIRS